MALRAMRLGGVRLHTKQLANQIGISESGAHYCLRQIRASKWAQVLDAGKGGGHSGPHVRFPIGLLTNGELSPSARLLYGFLQRTQGYRRQSGTTSIAELARIARVDLKTVRSGLAQLAATGWLATTQASQQAPIRFTLINPAETEARRELARVERRLAKEKFKGEGLMRALLSLLVDLDEFEDNASPGFLVNPLTDERLQFDRFYPPSVAFEFNGPQHYGETELYSAEHAREQRARDLIKIGICAQKGVTLVIVHAEDLSIAGMLKKINGLLPMRAFDRRGPVARYLESRCRAYRLAASRAPG